ncbi:tabersonine 16-hydroxylase 2-like [Hevea brasiliensis]|uniref:tabersonine 16-hydroxylase 2-like n=1 Tax=Hevea brasiliensis TaxID=3981 RepID=UPI0025E41EE9|nr:tabersonine 16-hydroxylase 2-like [Hevea brasiliensis]
MLLENIINEHRIYWATAKGDQGEAELEDIVHTLLNLQEHGDLEFPLTTNNIKAIILEMFIAGTDTSATVVEWAISELIKNPRVMSKAQAEVRQVLNRKRNVEEAGLEELKYLKTVIKETLRIHIPGPLLSPRENKEQCQINGYNIHIKTRVIVNAWAIGRDPDYWIGAEKFYPERFLECKIEFRGSNFEFLPFGAGRRMCPGLSFGIANLELPLAQLSYHCNWELPHNSKKEELDMRDAFGTIVRRKFDLCVIPIPCHP